MPRIDFLKSNIANVSLFGLGFLWFFHFATDYPVPGASAVATAAFGLGGILNPPGYPLFGIFSSFFNLLPFGNISLRANFMASVCGGISLVLVFHILRQWGIRWGATQQLSRYVAALGVGLWATSPIVVANFSHVEKYSIGILFLLGQFLYFSCLLERENVGRRQVFQFSVLSTLAFVAHYAYAPIVIWTSVLLVIRFRPMWKISWTPALVAGIVIGFLPILYLPLASMTDPILDWWDPETPAALWQTLTRSQYRQNSILLTSQYFGDRWQWQYSLLFQQWRVEIWAVVFVALIVSIKRALQFWRTGLALLIGAILTGELITARVRFFDPHRSIPSLTEGFQRYMWPFFLPWLLIMIALCIFTMVNLAASLKLRPRTQWFVLSLLAPFVLVSGFARWQAGKYPAVLPEWLQAIEMQTSAGETILTTFDGLYFAMLVAQQEGRFPKDRMVVHTSLSLMPWYHDSLERQYPDRYSLIEPQSRELKRRALATFADPTDDAKGFRWVGGLQEFTDAILHSSKSVFVISNINLMPINQNVIGRISRQDGIIGSWSFTDGEEMREIPWSLFNFRETFRGDLKEFPWLLGFRQALREDFTRIETVQKAMNPDRVSDIENFAAQLKDGD